MSKRKYLLKIRQMQIIIIQMVKAVKTDCILIRYFSNSPICFAHDDVTGWSIDFCVGVLISTKGIIQGKTSCTGQQTYL